MLADYIRPSAFSVAGPMVWKTGTHCRSNFIVCLTVLMTLGAC